MKELIAIAEQIAATLIANKQTIAVAESSTGGLISASLVAVPGASAYFLGGAVVYTRDARRRSADISGGADEGNPRGCGALCSIAGEPDPRALFNTLGTGGARGHGSRR